MREVCAARMPFRSLVALYDGRGRVAETPRRATGFRHSTNDQKRSEQLNSKAHHHLCCCLVGF
jgi:hypothetical protein